MALVISFEHAHGQGEAASVTDGIAIGYVPQASIASIATCTMATEAIMVVGTRNGNEDVKAPDVTGNAR